MKIINLYQHIDIKRIFIILLIFCCVITPVNAQAQTPTPPSAGTQIVNDLLNGTTTLNQAAISFSQQANIPVANALPILQNIQNLPQLAQTAAGNLVDSVIQQTIPPSIAQTLSTFQQLGQLTSPQAIANFFQDPNILAALNGLNPQQALQAIGTITNLVSNIQNLTGAALAAAQTAISNAIASTLQSVAPGLVSALGGQAAVAGLIGSLLGTSVIPSVIPGNSCTPDCVPACQNCAPFIQRNHQIIRAHVTAEFEQYRNWFVNNFFMDKIAPALGLMTSELTATGIQKIQIIGTFFDAKHQLETQRLFQTLTAQAHKDYHPSEEICKIGTGTRSLVTSERRSDLTQAALANRMMDRQLLSGDALSLEGEKSDRESRLALFINKYCNMDDHAGGLQQLCQNGSANPSQVNMDIDYTNSIENKLTLELDFTQSGSAPPATDDEENVFMLSSYLFANEVLPSISGDLMTYQNASSSGTNPVKDNANYYQEIRAIAAKRSVAQNSFAAITALKAEGDSEAAPFLKAILAETGINPTDINDRLGTNPSYFAQMEVLTKILYQDPNFYTNLIDKPVNNERMAAILEGIGNMQDRDIYDSIERSNAILATLISVMSQKEHQRIYNDLRNVK